MSILNKQLSYICDYYLNIADQLIGKPEGVIPQEASDRDLFSLLSDFYLNPPSEKENKAETDNTTLDYKCQAGNNEELNLV